MARAPLALDKISPTSGAVSVLARGGGDKLKLQCAASGERGNYAPSNISGIKLRGASFLMHQVYDDEMTFKLVAAASSVSGLPMEACLEEFGKHFLVYCQKNGYDQILRVLGSNLYDFLTNLDNLHDHLASIYPGMRAPSFRVTHNQAAEAKSRPRNHDHHYNAISGHREEDPNGSADMNASMYLHYYSERAGLSPIVKGLVMAVAREFFQTDIVVTECAPAAKLAVSELADDHVVLKIDRRAQEPEAARQPSAEDQQQVRMSTAKRLEISSALSSEARDSLVNSEIMMRTFPFHVIFDRHFNIVQVGNSLLRVTSLYWRSRAAEEPAALVKFSDLFEIVRPKIQFTFDAIAGHTNQVFVVRTKPAVLNADRRRANSPALLPSPSSNPPAAAAHPKRMSVCPLDRVAREHRRLSAGPRPSATVAGVAGADPHAEELADPSPLYLSLRLKGQMIILPNSDLPLCLYLCSPRVDHIDQLMSVGVNMSDFALYDRARELMLMSHTHKEDRENVKKLDQATNDLKKMDTKLRQENKRTNEVLHNIFPAKIAALLSHGHQIDSESFDPVTCLYSDIIGFTKMCGSENVRPIDIVRLLNTLYLQFDNLTNIHGVFKVETIGDAYVVVGGLPEPAEDHADRCVKMGLDMVKVIATVRSPADKQPIQMRIGIHSGPVMAGIVGIRVPRYSLFGNTTTLANQLETNGVGGKIHISDFTLKNLIKRDRFVIEPNPSEIAGFPSETFFVTKYMGDASELQYEKILEQQLIKDLELMGQEVEFVDESGAVDQQLAACPYVVAGRPVVAHQHQQQPGGWPSLPPPDAAEAAKPPRRKLLSESLARSLDERPASSQPRGRPTASRADLLMDIEGKCVHVAAACLSNAPLMHFGAESPQPLDAS